MPKPLTAVARILYKEITDGDLRKIRAESNDSKTGGGARDFRFGSFSELETCIKLMFPEVVAKARKRNNVKAETELFKGTFHWTNKDGSESTQESFFEPPTDARKSEGRITRIHEYPCFDTARIPAQGNGKILLLFIQRADGAVWPHFISEKSIRTSDQWNKTVAETIISCLDAKRPGTRSVIGFYDFETQESYCNGK